MKAAASSAASARAMMSRRLVWQHRGITAAASTTRFLTVRKEAAFLTTTTTRDFVTAATSTSTTDSSTQLPYRYHHPSSLLLCSTMEHRKVLLSSFMSNKTTNNSRFFSTDSANKDDTESTATPTLPPSLKQYYHIEASNAERTDATKLTVHGPDVDGILASMTVALAVQQGCSLMELHAAMADDVGHAKVYDDEKSHYIHDVFWVVQRDSGEAFPDSKLRDLAECLLEAAASPLTVVMSCSGDKPSSQALMQAYLEEKKVPIPKQQITVITGNSK